jgi:glucosamine-6-phosphate deaminase
MEIVIVKDGEAASALAADGIVQCIGAKAGAAVLGLATGSTPKGLYQELINRYRRKEVSFARSKFFALDEYVGLSAEHPASYHHYIREHFSSHIDAVEAHVEVPRGFAADLKGEAERYETAIRDAGGIDIQILGIGMDGHIGFNEPSSSLSSRTRLKTLSERTVNENAPHFPKGTPVPEHVLTMGIGTILDARTIYLLAFGEKKASIIARAVEGPVTAMIPASALQLHRHVTVFLDEAAASQLELREYYKRVWEKKPRG